MKGTVLKGGCAASIAVMCAFGLSACSTTSESGLTGGVAATVNGVEIEEDDVTLYIESIRASMGCEDDDIWGQYLSMFGYTPADIRSDVIDYFINNELVRQACEEQGIAIDEATIDSYVEQTKEKGNYSSDEAWQTALQSAGFESEDDYRDSIELYLLSEQLQNAVAPVTEPTEEELVEEANANLSSWDGAKRSSHILFSADDEATAQEVLDQINAGTLDFATAAQQYSTDSSAAQGGDVGWDKLTTFVDEYQTALDALEVGQVSGLVTSDYGIHIITCTDQFIAPETITSTDQIPAEFLEEITASLETTNSSTAYEEWIESYRESADIVINDMPSGLPYDVDMSAYETTDDESTDDAADASTTDESSDETAADETATDDATADAAATDAADASTTAEGETDSANAADE